MTSGYVGRLDPPGTGRWEVGRATPLADGGVNRSEVTAVKRNRLPVLVFVVGLVAAIAIAAAGPFSLAFAVMGIPFIALFVMLGGVSRGHVDNGHFRRPEPK
jgi:hypothetical protein